MDHKAKNAGVSMTDAEKKEVLDIRLDLIAHTRNVVTFSEVERRLRQLGISQVKENGIDLLVTELPQAA
jgi:hypothetical protein